MRSDTDEPHFRSWRIASKAFLALTVSIAILGPACGQRLDGFNVIATSDYPFGSASAERALIAAKRLGATTVAIIPFLWQASPSSPGLRGCNDMPDDALRQAIRQARSNRTG